MRIHENKLCELDSVEMERQTAIISYNTEAELSALQHKVAFLSIYILWTYELVDTNYRKASLV